MTFDVKLKTNKKPLDIKKYACYDHNSADRLSREINIEELKLDCYYWWYKLNDGYHYFKFEYVVTELLMAELFNSFGLDTVDFGLAKHGSKVGIISKNFRRQGMNYYDLDQFLNKKGGDRFNFYCNEYSDVDSELSILLKEKDKVKLMYQLNRMLALDFLTGQRDRFGRNIVLEENPETSSVTLCPLTDNSMIFDDWLDSYQGFFQSLVFAMEGLKLEDIDDPYVIETLKFIRSNRDLSSSLENTLDVEFENIIRRTIDKYGLIIPKKYQKEMLDYINKKKRIIENSLVLSRKIG